MRESDQTVAAPYMETMCKGIHDHIDIRRAQRQKNTKQDNNEKHMDTAESHRNQNNVGIANMKQITVAAQFILDHQEQHKLSQVLMNQTPDIRPGEREEEKKIEQRRSDKKWRQGRDQLLPVNLGSCLEDSGSSLLKLSLLLCSIIFSSFLFFHFILSSFLFSSALFSYCRLPVFPSLPFFDSFVG